MSGCSESEILKIESIYGKLPLSYRQIISLIGHSAGSLISDTSFYVSLDKNIDQIIDENNEYKRFRQEIIENNAVDDDLLKIPELIFIIHSWNGNDVFILTDSEESKKDSPVYVYRDIGLVEKKYSSVWEWIDRIIKI